MGDWHRVELDLQHVRRCGAGCWLFEFGRSEKFFLGSRVTIRSDGTTKVPFEIKFEWYQPPDKDIYKGLMEQVYRFGVGQHELVVDLPHFKNVTCLWRAAL